MKLIIVVALFALFVEESLCKPGMKTLPDEDSCGQRKLPYELPDLNPLDVHSLNSCGHSSKNGIPIRAWMGPCWNSNYCQIPHCCGIISGRNSTFVIEYEAVTEFEDGIFNGNCGGIGLGAEADGKDCQAVTLPFQFTVPNKLAGYSHDLCDQTICPQVAGEIYNLTVPFRFMTVIMTTLGIKADFVAEILTEDKERALCWGLYATLENVDLGKKVGEVITDVVTLDVLDNPFGTVGKLLPGLIPDNVAPLNLKTAIFGADFLKPKKESATNKLSSSSLYDALKKYTSLRIK